MNKQRIIKWCKRIIICLISVIGILVIGGLILLVYWKIYVPYEGNSLYEEGIKNPKEAVNISNKLLDSPYVEAEISYKAIDVLTNAAEKGHIDAQVKLAEELEFENIEKSSYWYLQAAKKGNSIAQWKIGINYKYGIGVKQSFSKAVKWIIKSTIQGNPSAQYELGNIYLYGLAFYDSYPGYFKGPYSRDYDYTHLIYKGNNIFIAKDKRSYTAKDMYLEEILSQPYNVYLYPNLEKAKYYWRLAANQGLQEAKDALEKIYE